MEEEYIDEDSVKLTIVDLLGYKEKERSSIKLGSTIILDKKYLKTGYLPTKNAEEFKKRILCVEKNPYILNKDTDYWYLYTIAGYDKAIKAITENNGIINSDLIENLFDDDKLSYTVVNKSITYTDCYKGSIGEKITEREAVKRYGLKVLDEVCERTVSHIIDKKFQINKRTYKLNKI